MISKKRISLLCISILLLTIIFSGCMSQKQESAPSIQTTAPTDAPESESKAAALTETETSEQQEMSKETEIPVTTEETLPEIPTLDPNLEIPEDTRPPIHVEIPEETHPETSFEAYNNMTEKEQKAFYDSFESPEAFFTWYNQAKEEYENTNNDIVIDDNPNIDLGG